MTYNAKDIGSYPSEFIPSDAVDSFVRAGPHPFPPNIPNDEQGFGFPYCVLQTVRANEEKRPRDDLSYSPQQESVYFFPCRLFLHKSPSLAKCVPQIAQPGGSGKTLGWKRLYKLKSHEESNSHKDCMFQWRELEARLKDSTTIENLWDKSLVHQAAKLQFPGNH